MISTPASISTAALPRISSLPAAPGSASARWRAPSSGLRAVVRDVSLPHQPRRNLGAVVLDLDGLSPDHPALRPTTLPPRLRSAIARPFAHRFSKLLAKPRVRRPDRGGSVDTPLSSTAAKVTDKAR